MYGEAKVLKFSAEKNLYFFTLHDSGGRIIEKYTCSAKNPFFAYKNAEKRGEEIKSHGITPCTGNFKPVENAYCYYHQECKRSDGGESK